jgi:hypothetical protein
MTQEERIEVFVEKLKTIRLTKSGPETLDASFIGAMQEIGLFGLLKHGDHSFAECKTRPPIENGKTRNMLQHVMDHMTSYRVGEPHELGDCRYHLAAAAFNLMMEFYFYQKETGN